MRQKRKAPYRVKRKIEILYLLGEKPVLERRKASRLGEEDGGNMNTPKSRSKPKTTRGVLEAKSRTKVERRHTTESRGE